MPRTRLLTFLVLCALMAMPIAALAQGDGGEEMQEYTSPDGLLTLSYPAGWVAEENTFLYGAVITNSQELMDLNETADENTVMPAGGVLVDITLASLDTFQMFGMDMEEGMTPEEMLGVFLDFISSPPEGEPGAEGEGAQGAEMTATEAAPAAATEAASAMQATEEAGMESTAEPGMQAPQVGEIQTVEFEDGRQAAWARVEFPGESSDLYLFFEVSDGAYAIVDLFTPSGELTDELVATGVQIAQSIQFTGTPEDLAPPTAEVEQSDVDPSTLDGNALVDERCTTCHTRERIDALDEDEEGWTAIVDRMISYGADLDSAERQAVIDYLVATH